MSTSVKSSLSLNNGRIRLLEAHDRSSVELIRKNIDEQGHTFDGVWISGLTQSTYLGIPDTELISPLKRATLMGSTGLATPSKGRPLCAIFDADSGGNVADIPALVSVLNHNGVSMVIIEDKAMKEPGAKVNSLLQTSGSQDQADMYQFAQVIRAFKAASFDKDMMVTARIESFTVRQSMENAEAEKASVRNALHDALTRARVYTSAGADAIMIHSKSRDPNEVIDFLEGFRTMDPVTPLVVVPTAYSSTDRTDLYDAGANIIIYANHLMRAKIDAIGKVSDELLEKNPGLFTDNPEMKACMQARNYGCLLHKLIDKRVAGEEEDEETKQLRHAAEQLANENMDAAIRELAGGTKCGCEADERIVPVKELLKINAVRVAEV